MLTEMTGGITATIQPLTTQWWFRLSTSSLRVSPEGARLALEPLLRRMFE